jgi:hypothetical protein
LNTVTYNNVLAAITIIAIKSMIRHVTVVCKNDESRNDVVTTAPPVKGELLCLLGCDVGGVIVGVTIPISADAHNVGSVMVFQLIPPSFEYRLALVSKSVASHR